MVEALRSRLSVPAAAPQTPRAHVEEHYLVGRRSGLTPMNRGWLGKCKYGPVWARMGPYGYMSLLLGVPFSLVYRETKGNQPLHIQRREDPERSSPMRGVRTVIPPSFWA